jgi:hypothetical protein
MRAFDSFDFDYGMDQVSRKVKVSDLLKPSDFKSCVY